MLDKDFLKELLIDFANMKELDWKVFDNYLLNNDTKSMELTSHSIKGVAGNLALTGIYHAATNLNDALKLGHLDNVKSCFEQLKYEVERFRIFLHDYLKS